MVDQAAAVLILQHALDTERTSGRAPGEMVASRARPHVRSPGTTATLPSTLPSTEETPVSDRYADDAVLDDEGEGEHVTDLVREHAPAGGRRRAKRRGVRSCLVLVVVFALVMVGGLLRADQRASEAIQDQFSDPADYAGPGTGEVVFAGQPAATPPPRSGAT